jgi:hypothetical protein
MGRVSEAGRGGLLSVKLLLAALCLLFVVAPAAEAAKDWQPQKTWVFVVGTLEWKDQETFESFPKENRRDLELVRFFRQEGVPPSQIVYLQDREATTRRIQNALATLLAKTQEGDTLFLYYTGHGYKTDEGKAYFASYDTDDEDNPGWSVDSIVATVERRFRGSRVFLTADCCYSGALADAVRARRGGSKLSYAVIASATSDKISTGNWTFTECLLAGLKGRAFVDTDSNGEITLNELSREIKGDMSFAERQTATFAFTGEFEPEMILADADAKPDEKVGARVVVRSEGDWYKARIVDARGGRYRVHYYGYEDSDDEWVRPAQIRNNDTRNNPTNKRRIQGTVQGVLN